MGFVRELRRRNEIRMGGLNLVGAWPTVQVGGALLPEFQAPPGIVKKGAGPLSVSRSAAHVNAPTPKDGSRPISVNRAAACRKAAR